MRALTKAVSVAASVVLSFSLIACGSNGSASTTDADSTEAQTTSMTEPEETTDTDQDADAKDETKDTQDEDTQDEDTLPTEFEHGTIDGNTYCMPFFGFTYSIGDDLNFANDEQLAALSGIVSDTLDNEDYTEYLESGQILIDMYAADATGYNNVNVTILNGESVGGENATVEFVRAGAAEGLEESLANAGVTNVKTSNSTVTIQGKELLSLDVEATKEDRTIYERMIFFKNRAYFGELVLAAPDEATLTQMSDGITLL